MGFICACCGTDLGDDFVDGYICYVCEWQADAVQDNNSDYRGGANTISLNEARENYKRTGKAES